MTHDTAVQASAILPQIDHLNILIAQITQAKADHWIVNQLGTMTSPDSPSPSGTIQLNMMTIDGHLSDRLSQNIMSMTLTEYQNILNDLNAQLAAL